MHRGRSQRNWGRGTWTHSGEKVTDLVGKDNRKRRSVVLKVLKLFRVWRHKSSGWSNSKQRDPKEVSGAEYCWRERADWNKPPKVWINNYSEAPAPSPSIPGRHSHSSKCNSWQGQEDETNPLDSNFEVENKAWVRSVAEEWAEQGGTSAYYFQSK